MFNLLIFHYLSQSNIIQNKSHSQTSNSFKPLINKTSNSFILCKPNLNHRADNTNLYKSNINIFIKQRREK